MRLCQPRNSDVLETERRNMPSTGTICGFMLGFAVCLRVLPAPAGPPSGNASENQADVDLRSNQVKSSLLADVDIFVKAEQWATRYPNADETPADIDLRKKALARADQ